MPFTPADASKYDKAASTPAKRRMWASIANAVLKKHGDDGMAIRVASSKVESLLVREPMLVETTPLRQALRAAFPRQKDEPVKKPKKRVPLKRKALQFFKILGKAAQQGLDPEFGR